MPEHHASFRLGPVQWLYNGPPFRQPKIGENGEGNFYRRRFVIVVSAPFACCLDSAGSALLISRQSARPQ